MVPRQLMAVFDVSRLVRSRSLNRRSSSFVSAMCVVPMVRPTEFEPSSFVVIGVDCVCGSGGASIAI